MAIDPTVLELLERYPGDLDDAERSSLASAAIADPDVAAIVGELDALEADRPDEEWPPEEVGVQLGDEARARMDGILAERAAAVRAPAANARPRARWLTAVAAALALGLAWWTFTPDPPGVRYRGDWAGTAELIVLDGGSLADDAEQPIDRPIRFQVLTNTEVFLVLVEARGGTETVVWPRGGERWHVSSGLHALQPGGASADYTPEGAGEARYVLYGSADALDVGDLSEARELDSVTVRWKAAIP